MTTRPKKTEADTLELYRVALENAVAQPEIATIMAELGYDSAKITEGKSILAQTRSAYDLNKTEDDESSAAYALFATKKEQLEGMFNIHRKKAKVIFRTNAITADKLAITGSMPRTYMKWLEAARKFYSVTATDTEIQGKLVRLKIAVDDITAANKIGRAHV